MKTLNQANIGENVKIKKIHGNGGIKRRILDMGITKDTEVFIRKAAPLGDPIQLSLRGFELILRKADAQIIEIEPA